ncbi:hypothetical protein [Pyruvatibacter sp.]
MTVLDKPELSKTHICSILLLDVLLAVALLWRDYSDPAQILVGHYATIPIFSDLVVMILVRRQLIWYNLFRLTGGITFFILIAALWAQGLNGDSLPLTAIQLLLISARILHAGFLWQRFGPTRDAIFSMPRTFVRSYEGGSFSERLACYYLVMAGVMLCFPQVAYWTHSNMGYVGLDAILVGFQGQQGINFALKLLVIELLVRDYRVRFYMRLAIAVMLVPQYFVMWPMISTAPVPFVHIGFELFSVALVWAAYLDLNGSKRQRPNSATALKSGRDT